jgi:DNA repair exonuclease SbcCD ATPase subunit
LAQESTKRDRLDALQAEIKHLQEGTLDSCPTCRQALGAEARGETIKSRASEAAAELLEAAALGREAKAIVIPEVPAVPEPPGGLTLVRNEIAMALHAQQARATLEERIRQSEAAAASGPAPDVLAAAYTTVQKKENVLAALPTVDIAAIENEGRLAKFALDNSKTALQSARSLVARLDERRVQMTAAEQALAEAATRTVELHRQIDVRVRLEKACGLNGVPALILETAVIPFMEAQAAEALAALGTPWQIEIRTQRAKKDGDLTDSCEVVVITETGESPFRKLSGGEQMRVSVALRVALSALMPGRSGIFCIDEPRWLDAAGIEALVESLRGLLGRYSKVYVVTQSGTALRDSFDSTLTVIKDGGSSRVLDGYAVESEAIAA